MLKKRKGKSRRYIWSFYMDFGDNNFVKVWGHPSKKRADNYIGASLHFNKRKGSRKYKGRQSYYHQPKKFMHVGWYADYMRDEWYVTYGRQRDIWCKRRNMRL